MFVVFKQAPNIEIIIEWGSEGELQDHDTCISVYI